MAICLEHGCPAIVDRGRCAAHSQERGARYGWQVAHDASEQRIRGRQLQRLRTALFAAEPLCRACRAQGQVKVATIRDHIIPIAEGGTDRPSNIQPLCADCSREKTQDEAQRGRQRGRTAG